MFASGIISILLKTTALGPFLFAADTGVFPEWGEIPFVMLVTTAIWLIATFITKPESDEVLRSFYKRIQPGGPGWAKVVNDADADNVQIDTGEKWSVPAGIMAMLLGVLLVYSMMFATGHWIYGKTSSAMIFTAVAIVSGILLTIAWRRMRKDIL
ncbi:unnamed protein product [Ectocarpus sp. 12 AP-2014]